MCNIAVLGNTASADDDEIVKKILAESWQCSVCGSRNPNGASSCEACGAPK